MREHGTQNAIRNALAGRASIFRGNVGTGWTGDQVVRLENGDVLIRNARPFTTGLPTGFSDLFGWTPRLITPADVGTQVAQFTAIECKAAKGRASESQGKFLAAVARAGGLSGVARSAEDALDIIAANRK
jgi:hypothetical protein